MGPTDPHSYPDVLIVEDDPTIGIHLEHGLQNCGYPTTWCRTGADALTHAREARPVIVLLDLGLPDIDGIELARTLRTDQPDALIIMLTARIDEIDIIVGLDAGADDYLVKPFQFAVLLARLRAHLRRHPLPDSDTPTVQLGRLTVDRPSRRCHLDGDEIALRPKEFDLLVALALQPGVAIRRADLMNDVWDENWYGSTKTLDVTMASLRKKLEQSATTAGLSATVVPAITTLRGHGYRLEPGR